MNLTAPAEPGPVAAPSRALMPALCALAITGPMGSFLYLPALPQLATDFAVSEAAIQGTLTAYLIGTCCGFAVFGALADRFGRLNVLTAAAGLFVVGSLGCAAADGLTSLTAARFLQGAGSVAGIITARATIRMSWPPAGARQMMAILSASMGAAPAASPLIGSLLLAVLDWRATFVVAAILSAAALGAAWVVLPGTRTAPAARTRLTANLSDLAGSAAYRSTVLTGSACNALFMAMMAGSPFVFIELAGMTPFTYSLVIGVALIGFSIVAVLSGRLAARVGSYNCALYGMAPIALAAASLVAAGLFAEPLALAGAIVFLITAMGLIVPNVNMLMLDPFPAIAATAASMGLLVGTIAGAISVTLFGLLAAGSMAGFGIFLAVLVGAIMTGFALYPAAAR